ncbi:MAG: hypothetical protein R6U22_10705 [Desulfohalobiaceae bacterium]
MLASLQGLVVDREDDFLQIGSGYPLRVAAALGVTGSGLQMCEQQ